MHLLYILFVIAAVALSTVRAFTTERTVNGTLIYLVTHAAWPPLLWLVTLVSALTPILYALFPPSMPDREELLDRNPKTGIAHPKEEWKAQRWSGWSWYYEMQYTLLTAFTTLVFVATFFITARINSDIGGSISGGGGPPQTPVVPVNLCGQFEDVNSNNGQYVIGTNQWGINDPATGKDDPGAQCLYYNPAKSNEATNTTAFQTTWSWTERINNVCCLISALWHSTLANRRIGTLIPQCCAILRGVPYIIDFIAINQRRYRLDLWYGKHCT